MISDVWLRRVTQWMLSAALVASIGGMAWYSSSKNRGTEEDASVGPQAMVPDDSFDEDISSEPRSPASPAMPACVELNQAFAACIHVGAANGTESLNSLCYRLKTSPSFVERLHAAEALAEYGDRAVPALRGLLQHPDSKVREFAAVALSRMGSEANPAVPELTRLLELPTDPLTSVALTTLSRIGPAAAPAVPAIARLLPDSDWRVREDAIEALASIGTVDAARALATQLERDHSDQQLETIMAIRECGPAAGAILSELVEFGSNTADGGLRDEVFLSIARLGEPAVEDLILLLNADRPELRRCAAMALRQMGFPGTAAVPELQIVLRDPDAAVRFWAARALGAVAPADPRVQFSLWQALSDPDPDVCWAAAESLGLYGMDEAGETSKGAD